MTADTLSAILFDMEKEFAYQFKGIEERLSLLQEARLRDTKQITDKIKTLALASDLEKVDAKF